VDVNKCNLSYSFVTIIKGGLVDLMVEIKDNLINKQKILYLQECFLFVSIKLKYLIKNIFLGFSG